MGAKILVVDDEEIMQKALQKFLSTEGYEVETLGNSVAAVEALKDKNYDLLITDLKMPNLDGIELIQECKKISPETACIVMTGFATINSAVDAVKAGAFHYVTKPFQLDDISNLVRNALENYRLREENQLYRKQIKSKYKFDNIIGASDQLSDVFKLVERVSDTDSTILVLGESGTGKELIAKAIHYNSRRADRPLVPVNCGAIPENLLESELFGHVKGAFTGAINSKMGRFEMANGGTVFLDEIGDMSLRLQVKILRVLQERKFEPVGSTKTVEVDVRIIAATHRDLEETVRRGEFREDLYYRLNVIPIRIPPLRERVSDIPLLVRHFANYYAQENNLQPIVVTDKAMELLCNYPWPGNVRELENTIERLAVLKSGREILIEDLPDKFIDASDAIMRSHNFQIPDSGISLKNVVNDFENGLILKALEKTGWNKNKAAHLLKLNRTTLVEKIKKKQLEQVMHS